MADITNQLIYEVLKALQGDIAQIKEGQREIKAELSAVRGHILAIQTDIANIYAKHAAHEVRLERIERRLDLIHEPAQ